MAGKKLRRLVSFEVPSSTEWQIPNNFMPNLFIDASRGWAAKIAALDCYATEMRDFPHPRSLQAITALAEWRGSSAGLPRAEAFVMLREIIQS